MKIAAALAALVLAASWKVSATDVGALLPDPNGLRPWHTAESPAEYDPSTLSHLIDGGAEVYLDYGFARAATADYVNGDDTITCTVYEMVDPQAAFGVFSYFRSGQKRTLAIGDAGFGSDTQIAFWQDRYFVTVETFSPEATRTGQLRTVADAVSSRIATHATPPAILARLPSGRTAGSEKLLRGRLAANALYTAWPSIALPVDNTVLLLTAQYALDGSAIWLVPFADRASLDAAWQTASKLRPDAGCELAGSASADLVCIRAGRIAAARRVGTLLAIVSGADTLDQATDLLERVQP